jgi:predicted RecB family nuclease
MSTPNAARVTAQDFFDYDKCPHRVYLNRFGDESEKQPQAAFLNLLFERALSHEEDVVSDVLCETPAGATLEARAQVTLDLMKRGVALIYHGVLLQEGDSGIPDLLEKVDGASTLGSHFYMPVDIKSGSGYANRETGELRPEYGLQLYHYGMLLQAVQGTFPPEGAILNRDRERVPYRLKDFRRAYEATMPRVRALVTGAATDEPALSSSCGFCQWWNHCDKILEETKDVTLLPDIGRSKKITLNAAGVRSIPQLSKFDFSRNRLKGIGPKTVETIKRAAIVSLSQKMQVLATAAMPNPPRKIYLDFEDDPTQELIYLCGMWIDPPLKGLNYHGLFSADRRGEKKIWDEFQKICAAFAAEDFAVFHYSPYEKNKLATLERKYGVTQSDALDEFRSRMVDLHPIVKDTVALPAKSYGLKAVAPFVGLKYSSADAGGAQSIVWFQDYQKNPSRADILETLLTYNKEDCLAMKQIESWLRTLRPGSAA